MTSDERTSLPRLKKKLKKFLLYQSVWRINKAQLYRTLRYSKVSTHGRAGFYYLQKAQSFHEL